jgi:hypothetical protein
MTNEQLAGIIFTYDQYLFNNAIVNFFKNHRDHQLTIEFDRFGQPGQYRNFGENGEIIETTGISGHSLIEKYTKKTIHRIFVSRPIFSNLFTNYVQKECSNGLQCNDQLECLLITLEHELVHLVIDLFCPKLKNGHGSDFQERVLNLFGQTKSRHSLGQGCVND